MLSSCRAVRKNPQVQGKDSWNRVHRISEQAGERMGEAQSSQAQKARGVKYLPLFWEEMGSTILIEELELAGYAQHIRMERDKKAANLFRRVKIPLHPRHK